MLEKTLAFLQSTHQHLQQTIARLRGHNRSLTSVPELHGKTMVTVQSVLKDLQQQEKMLHEMTIACKSDDCLKQI